MAAPEELLHQENMMMDQQKRRPSAEADELSPKRLKTDDGAESHPADDHSSSVRDTAPISEPPVDEQAAKEAAVGITCFVSPETRGFKGTFKQRYTDFLVHEILPSDEVLHLRNTTIPFTQPQATKHTAPTENQDTSHKDHTESKTTENKSTTSPTDTAPTDFQISSEDQSLLDSYFGHETARAVIALHTRALASPTAKPATFGRVQSKGIEDRDLRTKIHQNIRRIFASRLESSTDKDGSMVIIASPPRKSNDGGGSRGNRGNEPRGKVGWNELGGEYLHFTLYKENKDTMEAISFVASQLRLRPKLFSFAGTKDRRAVTVQRVSCYRVLAARLAAINKTLRNAVLGDFQYCKHSLDLGDLKGNEFVITLRDCKFDGMNGDVGHDLSLAKGTVSEGMKMLCERGYFNYYGLQRFGTFHTRTDVVGLKMLKGDLKGAIDAILDYNEALVNVEDADSNKISSDDIARSKAIHQFRTTGKAQQALQWLPRKFSAESNIIRHLSQSRNDHRGALQTIPRNLRLMYVHAYQSLVWNFAVGERWRLYGDKVVEGDLVLVKDITKKQGKDNNPAAAPSETTAAYQPVDADGEPIVLPAAHDSAQSVDDIFERARPLTTEEASSGRFSVSDIVLPLPGFDILYPSNEMTNWYKEYMGHVGMDPFSMRRGWKDISLSGSYRKVLSRPFNDWTVDVHSYHHENAQFVVTDLAALKQGSEQQREAYTNGDEDSQPRKIAAIIKLQLGSSQYATMALRELMKTGGVNTYKPDFGGGR